MKKYCKITSAVSFKTKKAAEAALKAASLIEDFYGYIQDMTDLSDYLDDYDMEHIGKAMDALNDFGMAVRMETQDI